MEERRLDAQLPFTGLQPYYGGTAELCSARQCDATVAENAGPETGA